ncbi:MAG TPA: hypothetical protein VJ858_02790, partial [Acidimicrobiia bacterium]|nr:hypothetical protein [Acidimicrobiia bacterium]
MTVIVMVVAVLCVLFAAWLRAAGTAVIGVARADALRDASDDVTGADTVATLLDRRESITPAVGVVASAFLIVGSVLATAALVPADSGAGTIA